MACHSHTLYAVIQNCVYMQHYPFCCMRLRFTKIVWATTVASSDLCESKPKQSVYYYAPAHFSRSPRLSGNYLSGYIRVCLARQTDKLCYDDDYRIWMIHAAHIPAYRFYTSICRETACIHQFSGIVDLIVCFWHLLLFDLIENGLERPQQGAARSINFKPF